MVVEILGQITGANATAQHWAAIAEHHAETNIRIRNGKILPPKTRRHAPNPDGRNQKPPTQRAIYCAKCGRPVGGPGGMPAVKIGQGVYRHASCH